MARCAICDKGAHFGNNVSHSHRRSNKMWKSNIKSVRVKVNGGTKKMYVCTSCLNPEKSSVHNNGNTQTWIQKNPGFFVSRRADVRACSRPWRPWIIPECAIIR